MSATYNAVSCCVTSWLGIATFRALKESRHSMSPMTRKMNAQMNRVLLVEACSCALVIFIPVGSLFVGLLLKLNIVGFGISMTMVFVWIPLLNPVDYNNAALELISTDNDWLDQTML
ncbi:serpentine type 7TM GPCR chemoreceptor str domain-containing protein [Ditylenchus destructor]|uniref:Serpentine type 7TM GPCR chemoreceptor str domain-containing protein n=1 Tax=Ditylenchus destructor TaxID=166010 RepID=A0AAD4MJ54_9BILA|nr:serpentine type 7TM GPCR chemoreceptor str domain-containing protein [Ditylenchus destructor]